MPLLNNQNSKTATRRVGLSKRQHAPPLLSPFQNPAPTRPSVQKPKLPKAYDDPPVSSEDEEDSGMGEQTPTASGTRTPPRTNLAASSTSLQTSSRKKSDCTRLVRIFADDLSSGDELATRGDIKGTTFVKTMRRRDAPQYKARGKRKDSSAEAASDVLFSDTKKQCRGETASASQRKETRPTPPPSSGEHLRDSRGFTKVKRSKMTYKKRDHSSQEQDARKGKDESKLCKIKVPKKLVENSELLKVNKLRVPSDNVFSSPTSKASAKLKTVPDFEDSDTISSPRPTSPFASSQGSTKAKGKRKLREQLELEQAPLPPRAVFRIPASPFGLELRTVAYGEADALLLNSASETESSAGEGVDAQAKATANTTSLAASCPWCGEEVDAELLNAFSKGKRLNVRLQTKFCQKHKKKSAQDTWQEKKYPRIDWDGLKGRFETHSGLMLQIINGSPSHFRSIHEKNIESGKARSMKKESNMNPGYYGPRGYNFMCDYLVEEYGDLLKKKAVNDKVISGRGSAAFIQNVLVPELAVRMIMKDMRVAEEEARWILEDSKALGELIHEEV